MYAVIPGPARHHSTLLSYNKPSVSHENCLLCPVFCRLTWRPQKTRRLYPKRHSALLWYSTTFIDLLYPTCATPSSRGGWSCTRLLLGNIRRSVSARPTRRFCSALANSRPICLPVGKSCIFSRGWRWWKTKNQRAPGTAPVAVAAVAGEQQCQASCAESRRGQHLHRKLDVLCLMDEP